MGATGATLGEKYLLLQELGRGGMGSVYAAKNTWTGRPVAIKTMHAAYAHSPTVLARFWQEARAASKLRHPHVVDVLDMGWDEPTGEPFLVQEFLDGRSLDRVLKAAPEGRLSCPEALATLLPIVGALVACHRVGLVHRDIKPSNIFLVATPEGGTLSKLIDFGISKDLLPEEPSADQTATGIPLGSPAYMAPEQALGERGIDARADVWAMGATLFELLAGRRLFEGPSAQAVLAKVIYESPPRVESLRPDVPRDVAAVLDRALQRDLSHRFASMADFGAALLQCEACRSDLVRAAPGFAHACSDIFNESSPGALSPAASLPDVVAPAAAPPASRRLPWLAVVAFPLLVVAVSLVALTLQPAPVVTAPPPAPRATSEAPRAAVVAPTSAPAEAAPREVPLRPPAIPTRAAAEPLRPARASQRPHPPSRRASARSRDSLAPDDEPYDRGAPR